MNDEELKAAAAQSMAEPGDIRERVRELTLAALRERQFDFAAVKDVMQQVTEGVTAGAEARSADAKEALSAAVKGMDEALSRTAQATRLAWSEFAGRSREFGESEIKSAVDAMKRVESDFVATLSSVADKAGEGTRGALRDIAEHAARTGTDAGAAFAKTASDLSKSMSGLAADVTQSGIESAKLLSERFAEATSGFLAGLSEAMHKPDDKSRN